MKKILEFLFVYLLKLALWFRYRVTVKGLEKLTPEALNKPGGVLFLPNHPCAFVDPTLVTIAVWPRFSIRPMIVEYMYYTPVINTIMRWMDALPIPNFSTSSNSLKRKKSEKVMQTVIHDLRQGQNFLIYPAGKIKHTGIESIGGASGVHQVIQEAPEANVVLVRTKGLWGSSFSTYFTGKTPPIFPTIWDGVKNCFKNLLFFTPRREVVIEFEPAPADFPYKSSRIELNKYLENWYNKPDGLTPQQGDLPGDSLVLVSYSMWGEKYPEVQKVNYSEDANINIDAIPGQIKKRVIAKLAELTESDPSAIKPEMNLSADLGLDSLDIAELVGFLNDDFSIQGVSVKELTTVGKLMAIASRQITCKIEVEEGTANYAKWKRFAGKRTRLAVAPGDTIIETFLNNCDRMGNSLACADAASGVVSYPQLKMRVILLADYIRHLPGEYVGILLPASVAASAVVLATQLAGKTPLMVNWTVGTRHLETVVKLSNVQAVLTSWKFLDRLDNVDLDGIEEMLIMLEDVRRELGIVDKVKALIRSKFSAQTILKVFKADRLTNASKAVLLFTSGTESMPKGVPLSHKNILANLRGAFDVIDVYSDDVLYGILPPFHSFGFAVSTIFGLLAGVKVANFPNPTDGQRLADGVEKWGITIMCGAPTFIKGMLKVATKEQVKTLRLCFTGAEKAPKELFDMMRELGSENMMVEGYGITECSPVITVNPPAPPHRGVGKALPGVEICIVHPETYGDLPTDTQGLILTRGPNVFAGYLNKDVASPFVEHNGKQWYKTGDLGFLDKDGFLFISGRLKRFIKVGGEMISLSSIEDALLQAALKQGQPAIQEGPALAICAKEIPGDKPKIYLFTRFNIDLENANQSLKDSGFSNLVRVTAVTQLNDIPIMGTGKVNYRALENQYLAKA